MRYVISWIHACVDVAPRQRFLERKRASNGPFLFNFVAAGWVQSFLYSTISIESANIFKSMVQMLGKCKTRNPLSFLDRDSSVAYEAAYLHSEALKRSTSPPTLYHVTFFASSTLIFEHPKAKKFTLKSNSGIIDTDFSLRS
jgi:hypothetical protein